jgi:phosphohistidine phosphatase
MKTLLVLRHAKSSRDNPHLDDHDRPLNDRGLRDAPRVGAMLKNSNLIPDEILSSTARRAQDTARLAAGSCDFSKDIQLIEEFYPGEPEDYITTLQNLSDKTNCVMVVGHNPGIEELIWTLTGQPAEVPTAGLTHLELPVDSWRQLAAKTKVRLISIWRPKENSAS